MLKEETTRQQTIELADAHCHIDLFSDMGIVKDSIAHGVLTIVSAGVDTKSNMKVLELSDNLNVFAVIGIDPEHALAIDDKELEFNLGLIRENSQRIVGIGEIGLDYKIAVDQKEKKKQRIAFEKQLDLAKALDLPVSIHARDALSDVMETLKEKKMRKAHLHFFEGDVEEARAAMDLGCYISIPPLKSGKRKRIAKEMPLDRLMAETDSPVVGKSPMDVELVAKMVADARSITYAQASKMLSDNTKNFFNIQEKLNKHKTRFIRQ